MVISWNIILKIVMEAFEVNYDLIEYHKIKISSDEVKKS